MKTPRIDRKVFCAIFSGTYSPLELHEFVQLCYSLALPVIRKKIVSGKLSLDIIGLTEEGIVQDCLADLFHREDSQQFPQIVRFFQNQIPNLDQASDERLLLTLRRLVLGKVSNNIIRLYAEADPILGKIVRNVTLALERTHLFEKHTRFGEAHLIVRGIDPLLHLPPISMDCVQKRFAGIALVRDTIPQMMKKLHKILSEQTEYQRTVPLVGIALMFKEVYALGWEHAEQTPEQQGEAGDIPGIIDDVCRRLEAEMHRTYVGGGKRSSNEFRCYMLALKEVLTGEFVHNGSDSISYFDHLRREMPHLTKTNYAQQHRTAFEYMAKTAKERVRKELQKM